MLFNHWDTITMQNIYLADKKWHSIYGIYFIPFQVMVPYNASFRTRSSSDSQPPVPDVVVEMLFIIGTFPFYA